MRRLFVILFITLASCAPRFHEMSRLLHDNRSIDIPFDQSFLKYQADMDSFAKLDQLLPDSLGKIVFVGSSSIRMWKNLKMDMDTFPYAIVNRGFGGSTMPDVNYYFDQLVKPHKAKATVLYCGENDIAKGYKATDVFNSFYTFLRLFLKNDPTGKLLYVSMKPSPSRWSLWPEFKRGNNLIRRYIKRLKSPNISYVDISEPMIDRITGEPDPSIFLSDQLHMKTATYQLWKTEIEDAVLCILEDELTNV